MTTSLYPAHLTHQLDALTAPVNVIPVLTIQRLEDAIPLAEALAEGGLTVLEVTLRSAVALQAIEAIARTLPQVKVGAGTVLNPEGFDRSVNAGSQFIVSPGSTQALLQHGCQSDTPFLPGIQTVSEMMEGIQLGYQRFKFFPAEAAGGTNTLKALAGPFADIRFCPTGGIRASNVDEYRSLANVMCVGGTWLAPASLVAAQDWAAITELAKRV